MGPGEHFVGTFVPYLELVEYNRDTFLGDFFWGTDPAERHFLVTVGNNGRAVIIITCGPHTNYLTIPSGNNVPPGEIQVPGGGIKAACAMNTGRIMADVTGGGCMIPAVMSPIFNRRRNRIFPHHSRAKAPIPWQMSGRLKISEDTDFAGKSFHLSVFGFPPFKRVCSVPATAFGV